MAIQAPHSRSGGRVLAAWSPDGRYIAFLPTLSPTTSGVFVVAAVGGAERKLTETYQDDPNRGYYGPNLSWTPDSRWLVLPHKEAPNAPSALFRLSLETGEKRRLTAPPPGSSGDWQPAVSPDGHALAFRRSITENVSDLYLLELSKNLTPASEPKRLTTDNSSSSPAWSPDGRVIVYCSGSTHTPNLWKITLSQPGWRPGKTERLTFAGEGVMEPAIFRQGRLAYSQMAIDVDIWRLELNGTHPAMKPPCPVISSTRVDHDPRYSPDGKHIVFASNRSGGLEIW